MPHFVLVQARKEKAMAKTVLLTDIHGKTETFKSPPWEVMSAKDHMNGSTVKLTDGEASKTIHVSESASDIRARFD